MNRSASNAPKPTAKTPPVPPAPSPPKGSAERPSTPCATASRARWSFCPKDDLAAYQRHCTQFHAELKPQGLLETKAVQTIADSYWRLDRTLRQAKAELKQLQQERA